MRQIRWSRILYGVAVAATAILLPRAASAQNGKISGVITDAGTGQPIEGVQVVVQGTGYGALTQPNGRYFIISVPPGTYTVSARRIGYQSAEVSNVAVRIDATREIDFKLGQASAVLSVQRIVAPPTPLVERGVTGSAQAISTEVINALPVTSVSGVLSLQQGFLQVPQNTDIVSFTDTRRNVVSPIRIRGGRGGSTQTLIDGIPINNVVFGDRAFDVNNFAIQQLDFQKGGFEPQYGNAISGIINIATREGGTTVAGGLEYQNTGLAGSLGSTPDELFSYDLVRGYLSGPVPGTNSRLRFAVAGQLESSADQVIEFDESVYDFDRFDNGVLQPEQLDIASGWRQLGFNEQRDIMGKLTFTPSPLSKLNVLVVDYQRQRQPYDQDYQLAGFDPLDERGVNSLADTLGLLGFRGYRDIVQSSITADRRLYAATFEQRFGRSSLQLRGAQFEQERNTCNYFQGVCLGARFSDRNFNDRFTAPGITQGNPSAGTDDFFGGENVKTSVIRADLQSQVTDHHNLQGGVFYQRHDIDFREQRNLGTNDVFLVPNRYGAKPFETAAYFQDRIEYDFLTVKLGARFDYSKAEGSGFRDPQNPTNGTTAREVCQGLAPSIGATTAFSYTDPTTGQQLSGLDACNAASQVKIGTRPALLDSAVRLAQVDDFREAESRVAFSPRIGIAFPLSERSQFFANAGRYAQNPLYNNLYQNSGVGTIAGAEQGVCQEGQSKPGSEECYPTLAADAYTAPFVGNPNLLLEQATMYELGYAAEFGSAYAVNVIAFNRDETGLSGVRRSRAVQDIGTTYSGVSQPSYLVIVNNDYQTSRGFEVQFRRRVQNFWGYDINYSYSKATTNAPPPERQQQSIQEGDSLALREIRSEIDQPHAFNTSLYFQVQENAPEFTLGNLLRNTNASVTLRASSGLPYTPIANLTGFGDRGRGELNSGRGPATFQVDLQAGKDFQFSNVKYGAFVRVANLTDRRNCVQVFVTTGRCDAGIADPSRARSGNNNGTIGSSTFVDRAEFIGQRRQIYTGARLSF